MYTHINNTLISACVPDGLEMSATCQTTAGKLKLWLQSLSTMLTVVWWWLFSSDITAQAAGKKSNPRVQKSESSTTVPFCILLINRYPTSHPQSHTTSQHTVTFSFPRQTGVYNVVLGSSYDHILIQQKN